MVQPISVLFLFKIIIIADCSISIPHIRSAAYVPDNMTGVELYTGTCSECVCYAFISNQSSTYEALNCYITNDTCLLFRNFISRSFIRTDTNSKLIFSPFTVNITSAFPVSCADVYGQCGGILWNGTTSCCAGLSCVYNNESYSQCLPSFNSSTVSTDTVSLTTEAVLDVTRLNATTGTYWGCCKTSCSWPYKSPAPTPPKTCQQDGVSTIDSNTASICDYGTAYMCTNQQPWNVSENLSYGYAGANIIGQTEWNWCCTCYSLVFTSGLVVGKEMIVQIINTAYSANDLFVLQIPGSGWGSTLNGCSSQFGGSYAWGQQYGGVSNRSDCANLPNVLQAGCYWRFDWFRNSYQPGIRYKVVSCPSALTDITGCIRS